MTTARKPTPAQLAHLQIMARDGGNGQVGYLASQARGTKVGTRGSCAAAGWTVWSTLNGQVAHELTAAGREACA